MQGFPPTNAADPSGRFDVARLGELATCAAPAERLASRSSAGDSLVGHVIAGSYRLVAKLGAGAMGAVYRARRLPDGAEVAVKVMHPRLTSDETVAQRFDREALAAARLDHRHCVRVLDSGTSDEGHKYLVMPLLPGVELREHMLGPMPAGRVVALVDQVLAGLEHAHAHGFVHRDVKPENVFVVQDPVEGEVLKLLDFGLVKLLEPAPGRPALTREGLVFGTPTYMSPEQAAGQPVDARADLYGVGVMMYEMLTGAPPFEADEAVVLLRRHMLADPPPLPAFVPAALAAFVGRLLQKEPSDRFASASTARAGLAAAAVGRDSVANCAPPSPRVAPSPAQLSSWDEPLRFASHRPEALLRSNRVEQRAFAILALVLGLLACMVGVGLTAGDDGTSNASQAPATTADAALDTAEAPAGPKVASSAPAAHAPLVEQPSTPRTEAPVPAAMVSTSDLAEPSVPAAVTEPAPKTAAPAPKAAKRAPKVSKGAPIVKRPDPIERPRALPAPEPKPETRTLRTDRPPRGATTTPTTKLPNASPTSKLPRSSHRPQADDRPAVRHRRPVS